MQKIDIKVPLDISNGEWDPEKKVSQTWDREHTIDLATINDENVFAQAKNYYLGEFSRAFEKNLNACIQRMLDGGRSDKEEADKAAGAGTGQSHE
jgi:hypothetical protein